jgi:hypothetical protein
MNDLFRNFGGMSYFHKLLVADPRTVTVQDRGVDV